MKVLETSMSPENIKKNTLDTLLYKPSQELNTYKAMRYHINSYINLFKAIMIMHFPVMVHIKQHNIIKSKKTWNKTICLYGENGKR